MRSAASCSATIMSSRCSACPQHHRPSGRATATRSIRSTRSAFSARRTRLVWTSSAYYHSHPDHPPSVSFDTERAWAGYVYVIVSIEKGKPVDANAFVADTDGGPFTPSP